jgi:endonuclease-3
VLLFAFGRPEFPVDTHVDRVGKRLGLFRPRATFAEEHDEMLRLTEPAEGYELHINLIRHGRSICVARSPRCHVCPLRRMCPYGRGRLAAGASAAAMDP